MQGRGFILEDCGAVLDGLDEYRRQEEYGVVDVKLGAQEVDGCVEVIEAKRFVVLVDDVIEVPFRVDGLFPYRVATSAIAGVITDPRNVL